MTSSDGLLRLGDGRVVDTHRIVREYAEASRRRNASALTVNALEEPIPATLARLASIRSDPSIDLVQTQEQLDVFRTYADALRRYADALDTYSTTAAALVEVFLEVRHITEGTER